MDDFDPRTIERLARIEENIKFIRLSMESPPQSPQCVTDIKELRERMDAVDTVLEKINTKMTYAGGVLVAFGSILPYVIPWLITRLGINP